MKPTTSERLSHLLLAPRTHSPSGGSQTNGVGASQAIPQAMHTTGKCRGGLIEVCVGPDIVALASTASNEQAIARIEQHLRGTDPSAHEAIDLAPLAIARVTSL